ncbi:MAG: hypothetical protein ACE5FN_12470 [Leptospirillia bacterium]
MSGALPTSPAPARIDLSDVTGAVVSRSLSGKRFARLMGGQRWRVRVRYPVMTRQEFAPIWAFLAGQQGPFGSFSVIPSDLATPRGSWPGVPVVSGAHGQGVTAVTIGGFTNSTPGVAMAGDLIRFNGHTKAYLVTADANSGATGLATVLLNTPLVAPLVNAEPVISANTPVTISLDGPVQSYSVGRGLFYEFEFDAVEV